MAGPVRRRVRPLRLGPAVPGEAVAQYLARPRGDVGEARPFRPQVVAAFDVEDTECPDGDDRFTGVPEQFAACR